MKAIAPPIKPKLQPGLQVWDGRSKGELELTEVHIAEANFTQVQRLTVDGCTIENLNFGTKLEKMSVNDAALSKIEAAGLQTYKAYWLRVEITSSRLTGADFGAADFEDCLFRGVKLDEAGFRFATFKRVRFENCVLRAADFSNAHFTQVVFDGCELEAATFDKAICKMVDMRGENLSQVKGILGFKGATISDEQLIQIAPLLAVELGFAIAD